LISIIILLLLLLLLLLLFVIILFMTYSLAGHFLIRGLFLFDQRQRRKEKEEEDWISEQVARKLDIDLVLFVLNYRRFDCCLLFVFVLTKCRRP